MTNEKFEELGRLRKHMTDLSSSIAAARTALTAIEKGSVPSGHKIDGAGIGLWNVDYRAMEFKAGSAFIPHAEKALTEYIEELEHELALARVKFKHA